MIAAAVLAALALAPGARAEGVSESEKAWRSAREARLRADDGWLTVVGLFWLHEGENHFGSAAGNDIALPAGPAQAGVFEFHAGKTRVRVAGETNWRELKPDTAGPPDTVTVGDLTMFVIERGGRYGIRLKDKNNKARREFSGLRWFNEQSAYRVTARFVPASGVTLTIPNVLGQTERTPSPGFAEFRLQGRSLRLYPIEEDGRLFFIFRDLTSGKETYPAGRFLYADPPKDGKVMLDFNHAVNPPCAFTAYATCPLPPPENRLPVRVEAGEMRPVGH